MGKEILENGDIIVSNIVGDKLHSKYIKRGKVVLRMTYSYIGHKNEEEAKHNQKRVDRAYDILFDEVLKNMKDKPSWLR